MYLEAVSSAKQSESSQVEDSVKNSRTSARPLPWNGPADKPSTSTIKAKPIVDYVTERNPTTPRYGNGVLSNAENPFESPESGESFSDSQTNVQAAEEVDNRTQSSEIEDSIHQSSENTTENEDILYFDVDTRYNDYDEDYEDASSKPDSESPESDSVKDLDVYQDVDLRSSGVSSRSFVFSADETEHPSENEIYESQNKDDPIYKNSISSKQQDYSPTKQQDYSPEKIYFPDGRIPFVPAQTVSLIPKREKCEGLKQKFNVYHPNGFYGAFDGIVSSPHQPINLYLPRTELYNYHPISSLYPSYKCYFHRTVTIPSPSTASNAEYSRCGKVWSNTGTGGRIIRGNNTMPGEFPFMAALLGTCE